MKPIYLIIFLCCGKFAFAHQPDLSSLMIYEQNGKYLLLIKSSLTAFEGEIDYHFKPDSYKTPEAFQELVIRHFQKNCSVSINHETIKFKNPRVMLGHETTIFVELLNVPNKINAMHVKNTFFQDMPNNICELILTIKGLPQIQYILNKDNKQAVKLRAEKNNWIIEDAPGTDNTTSNSIIYGILALISFLVISILIMKRKKSSDIGLY